MLFHFYRCVYFGSFIMICVENEQCSKSKAKKEYTKQEQNKHRPVQKKLRYKQMLWRSENPLLVGNTSCVLFVGIKNNGKKSVDNRVINYCHNQTLLISVLCCLICYGFILLKPSALIDFSFFPYGVRVIKFWHWSA